MPPITRKPLDASPGDPTGVLEQVTDGYLLLDDTVIAFADADHIAGIVLLIARRTGLLLRSDADAYLFAPNVDAKKIFSPSSRCTLVC